MSDGLYIASVWLLPILLAVTLHEAAHGLVARMLGDDTAARQGRVTLNPLRHIDLFGTVLLPALLLILRSPFLFGYAKPVPVNFFRLRGGRLGMVAVALAGPATNILLAAVSVLGFTLIAVAPETSQRWLADNLANSLWINSLLAVFNMLPLPPLDGGRVAVGLLPRQLAIPLARLEPAGLAILLTLIFLLPLGLSLLGVAFNPFVVLVVEPARWIAGTLLGLGGIH